MRKYFRKFFRKEEAKIIKKEDIVFQMYKDRTKIETIMVEMDYGKMEIMEIIQNKKKELRGE